MIPPIPPITPGVVPAIPAIPTIPTIPAPGVTAAAGANFAGALGHAVASLQGSLTAANTSAIQAAAGQTSMASYMVAASKAQLATELAVNVRDRAVSAFNQIINLPI